METKTKPDVFDLIIIGGGCAGLTAAIYAARAGLKTMILEKQFPGGQAAITGDIANYPGFESIPGPDLTHRITEQAKALGANLQMEEVRSIAFQDAPREVKTLSALYKAHALILASGANPKIAGFEGEKEFTGRGVGYCATCDGFFYRDQHIFVIGGGYSAAEEALYLTRFGKKVTIVVRKDQFRCAQTIVSQVLANPKIEVLFQTEIMGVYGKQKISEIHLKNNRTNELFVLKTEGPDAFFGVFVFVGYQPNNELYQGILEMDDQGYLLTDPEMKTKIPGVFAAGDIRGKSLRQLVTATSDGAIAAVQAEKYISHLK